MQITIDGKQESLYGNPPEVGDKLPKFKLESDKHEWVKTADIIGRITVLTTVPDINTPTCNIETKRFNQEADMYPDARFITVSNNTVDQQRNWCAAEGVANLQLLSDEELSLGYAMKVYLPNDGELARTIFIIDQTGKIVYREIVADLSDEPDYAKALAALNKIAQRRVDD